MAPGWDMLADRQTHRQTGVLITQYFTTALAGELTNNTLNNEY